MNRVPRTQHQAGTTNEAMKPLTFYQYNVAKSKDMVMAQFMRDPTVLEADIIHIQEPWRNPFQSTTHNPAKLTHELLYPEVLNLLPVILPERPDADAWMVLGDFNLHHPS